MHVKRKSKIIIKKKKLKYNRIIRPRLNDKKFAPQTFLKKLRVYEPNVQLEIYKTMINNHPFNSDQLNDVREIINRRCNFDIISALPYEIALYIMSFLTARDLCQASLTCKSWQTVCEDSRLWREKCQEESLIDDQLTFESLFRRRMTRRYSKYREIARISLDHVPKSEWKAAYIKHIHILRNWRTRSFNIPKPFIAKHGRNTYLPDDSNPRNESFDSFDNYQNNNNVIIFDPRNSIDKDQYVRQINDYTFRCRYLMQLRCHEDSVITCLQYNPRTNIILSGSDDQTLKLWSAISGECINTLEGHTGGVWSSQLSPEDIVISGSTDRTLKVWDGRSGKLKHTLTGHTSTVRCLALQNNEVVSGSRDKTLRLWDIKKGRCLNVFSGHSAAVRCVEFKNDVIVSGAYDHLVMIWDAKTGTVRHSLESHTDKIYCLQFDGRIIASGSLDSTICIWNAEQGKLIHQLEGHESLTSKMQLKGNLLVSANADHTCRVWNLASGDCLHTLGGNGHGHTSAITSVYFNSRHVVTSSDDGTVKLWDIKTGQFLRNLIVLPTAPKDGVVWRIRACYTKLICAVGSRSQLEDTHLLVLDFDNYD